jgi:hypothetical protein
MQQEKRTNQPLFPDRPNSNNTTGYRGVSVHKPTGRFQVTKTIDGRHRHLGYKKTIDEAVELWESL